MHRKCTTSIGTCHFDISPDGGGDITRQVGFRLFLLIALNDQVKLIVIIENLCPRFKAHFVLVQFCFVDGTIRFVVGLHRQ